jgi:hypothetical protein
MGARWTALSKKSRSRFSSHGRVRRFQICTTSRTAASSLFRRGCHGDGPDHHAKLTKVDTVGFWAGFTSTVGTQVVAGPGTSPVRCQSGNRWRVEGSINLPWFKMPTHPATAARAAGAARRCGSSAKLSWPCLRSMYLIAASGACSASC